MPLCTECGQDYPVGMGACPYCKTRHCPRCYQRLPPNVDDCPICGSSPRPERELPGQYLGARPNQKVSNKWYLLPIILGAVAVLTTPLKIYLPFRYFYGAVGGGLAYWINRKKDYQKAEKFLIVGGIMLFVSGIMLFVDSAI